MAYAPPHPHAPPYPPPHPHGPPYPPPPFRPIVPPAVPPPLFGFTPPLPFPYALPIHSRHQAKTYGPPITTRKRTDLQSTRDNTATKSPHKRQKVSHSPIPVIKSSRATPSSTTSKTQLDVGRRKTLHLTLEAPVGEKSHEASQRSEEQQMKEKGRGVEEDTDSRNDTFEAGLTEEQIQKALATLDYDSLPPYTLKEFAPQWTISEKLAGPKLFAEWQRLSGATKG